MRLQILLAVLALAFEVQAVHLSDTRLSQVYNYMDTFAKYSYVPLSPFSSFKLMCSWENGTKAQAKLEYTYPDLSVFSTSSSSNPFPSQGSISSSQISQILDIARVTLQNRPATNTSGINGGSTLLEDGAAADPASLGGSVLLANAAGAESVKGVGYGDAARMEVAYLLYNVPRVSPPSRQNLG